MFFLAVCRFFTITIGGEKIIYLIRLHNILFYLCFQMLKHFCVLDRYSSIIQLRSGNHRGGTVSNRHRLDIRIEIPCLINEPRRIFLRSLENKIVFLIIIFRIIINLRLLNVMSNIGCPSSWISMMRKIININLMIDFSFRRGHRLNGLIIVLNLFLIILMTSILTTIEIWIHFVTLEYLMILFRVSIVACRSVIRMAYNLLRRNISLNTGVLVLLMIIH